MLILECQRRASGRAYAGIIKIAGGDHGYTLVLEHSPVGDDPWVASLFDTNELLLESKLLWQSDRCEAATQAIDALLEHIAPLGLPDDLMPLVNELLPDRPIGEPLYQR